MSAVSVANVRTLAPLPAYTGSISLSFSLTHSHAPTPLLPLASRVSASVHSLTPPTTRTHGYDGQQQQLLQSFGTTPDEVDDAAEGVPSSQTLVSSHTRTNASTHTGTCGHTTQTSSSPPSVPGSLASSVSKVPVHSRAKSEKSTMRHRKVVDARAPLVPSPSTSFFTISSF